MQQTLTTCLWFDGKAEEAMNFYLSIFKNSKIGNVSRYGESGPGQKGTVMVANFQINGQDFIGLNGGPMYSFTPAISLVVNCDTQGEVATCGTGSGRTVTQPLRLGHRQVRRLLADCTACPRPVDIGQGPGKIGPLMKAMLGMTKIDIAGLQRAYDGA